jgi:REP element-mobilizing transposase RayT
MLTKLKRTYIDTFECFSCLDQENFKLAYRSYFKINLIIIVLACNKKRCVRRSFLCGENKQTHQSYEHRRQWVEDKLLFLPQAFVIKSFAIEVCAYAVMSNHTHVVLHVNEQQALNWNTTEVLTRWHKVFKGTLLTPKYLSLPEDERHTLSKSELIAIEQATAIYRKRLMDISWFMRVLNEGIARQANKEDNCTEFKVGGNVIPLQNFTENLQLKRRPNLSSCRRLLA